MEDGGAGRFAAQREVLPLLLNDGAIHDGVRSSPTNANRYRSTLMAGTVLAEEADIKPAPPAPPAGGDALEELAVGEAWDAGVGGLCGGEGEGEGRRKGCEVWRSKS